MGTETRDTRTRNPRQALAVSAVCSEAETARTMGREAYSYRFVYRAFAPLLERWAHTIEVTRPESRLDYALWQLRKQDYDPVHLSFLPLHLTYLTAKAPNLAYPFWEFPDVPDEPLGNNSRHNWVRIAANLALILTASPFTRDAFRRAGVTTPIHVVPVPIRNDYFAVPAWEPTQHCVIDVPAYVFPQEDRPAPTGPNPWVQAVAAPMGLKARAKHVYKMHVRPRLPARLDKLLTVTARTVRSLRQERHAEEKIIYPASPRLELSGVVFTTLFNPFCPRKNWHDLLTAFLLAFQEREDATLVFKLVVPPDLAAGAVNGMIGWYRGLGLKHRCKVAFVSDYLSDAQMVELARASTYYVNTARAEGACLPLQDFLAARRLGIAPVHTALADYFHDGVGFVVDSHPEPARWPHDPAQHLTTWWHRLVWQSLHDQLQAGYSLARQEGGRYQEMASRAREEIHRFAAAESVWPHLAAALDSLDSGAARQAEIVARATRAVQRKAS